MSLAQVTERTGGGAYPVKVVDGGAGGKVDDEFRGSAVCCFRCEQTDELERLFSGMAGDVGVLQAVERISALSRVT